MCPSYDRRQFHEGGFKQAALYQGRWKGIRKGGFDIPIQLYDQSTDIAETKNVADQQPEIASKISDYLKGARTESADWKPIW
jgi:arylsulfatase A-like enzyme